MKALAATMASVLFVASAHAQQPDIAGRRLSPDDVRAVAPALEKYTQDRLYGELWNRPALSRRDRSIVTVAALIARQLTPPMPYYFNQALDNGVKPAELSEIITHLAFYSGWANAFAAIGPARDVFARRGIGPDQLPAATPQRLAARRSRGGGPGVAGRTAVRHRSAGHRAVHDGRSVSGPVAAPRPGAPRPEPGYGERPHCFRPSRADALSLEQGHG